MRVLLAIDGSATSDTARELVASFTWPEATIIRVVAVVEPMSAVLVGMPSPYVATEGDDRAIVESLERRLAEAAERLALEAAERIRAADFAPNPGKRCRTCEVRTVCGSAAIPGRS